MADAMTKTMTAREMYFYYPELHGDNKNTKHTMTHYLRTAETTAMHFFREGPHPLSTASLQGGQWGETVLYQNRPPRRYTRASARRTRA